LVTFDAAQAKQWIAKYFSDLPQGKPVQRPTVPLAKLDAEKHWSTRIAQLPRLYIEWPHGRPRGKMTIMLFRDGRHSVSRERRF